MVSKADTFGHIIIVRRHYGGPAKDDGPDTDPEVPVDPYGAMSGARSAALGDYLLQPNRLPHRPGTAGTERP